MADPHAPWQEQEAQDWREPQQPHKTNRVPCPSPSRYPRSPIQVVLLGSPHIWQVDRGMCVHTKRFFILISQRGTKRLLVVFVPVWVLSVPVCVTPGAFPCLQVDMPYSACMSACWQWNSCSALLLGAPGAQDCGSLTSTGLRFGNP